jgi:hypothetical protein
MEHPAFAKQSSLVEREQWENKLRQGTTIT